MHEINGLPNQIGKKMFRYCKSDPLKRQNKYYLNRTPIKGINKGKVWPGGG